MVNQDELISMLEEIATYERGYKHQAFINAAAAISGMTKDNFDSYIESGNYTSLHGVGKSVSACIKEFAETGFMTRLDNHRQNDSDDRLPFL